MNRIRQFLGRAGVVARAGWAALALGLIEIFGSARGRRVLALLAVGAGVGLCVWRPPVKSVEPGTIGVRINRLTGGLALMPEGPALVLPLVHELQRYPLRDQIYRPEKSAKSGGDGAFQSVEGLSIGVEVTVRYALDPERVAGVAKRLPQDIGGDLVEPLVDGVLHRELARHSVRDIFTDKRQEIQEQLQRQLVELLKPDGVIVRGLFIGHVDLPEQYRAGLEGMLSEELATQKMKYTLELKQKRVAEHQLEGEAAKVTREKAAEAAAMEEVIAAKGKAEAMKHVLPLKEKEIEQRRLEAEARKVQRTKDAEGEAAARGIEAQAEADARRKLSDADAYRIEVTGKASSAQMERDSALIARNPLLIQKTLADKLSDKIQVVVAPPSSDGFFASGLLGLPAGKPANDNAGAKKEAQ